MKKYFLSVFCLILYAANLFYLAASMFLLFTIDMNDAPPHWFFIVWYCFLPFVIVAQKYVYKLLKYIEF